MAAGAIARRAPVPGRELAELLGPALPADHARQTIADDYIPLDVARAPGRPWRVLDLGCGAGHSAGQFLARDAAVQWVGLDLPDSPEARLRPPSAMRFETFDGVSIPFEDESFDLVYCKQVLEHVRAPAPLLAEVGRVLAAGGYLAGSTSQLEPFHSLSLWNYTPLGFAELVEEAGLTLVEVRPGIDAVALIARRLTRRSPRMEGVWGRWWMSESPLNRLINVYGRLARLDPRAVNGAKLLFSGQFAFLARRED